MNYNDIHLFYNECFHSKKFIVLCGYMINIHVLRHIHKLYYSQGREKLISLPQSKVVSVKFFTFSKAFLGMGLFSSGAGCQNVLLSRYFQGQKHHIFSPVDWADKRLSLYSRAWERESFSLSVNKNKSKRWKESSFTENKKACTKNNNVESREKVHYILSDSWDMRGPNGAMLYCVLSF